MVVLLQACTSLYMQNTNCIASFLSTYAVCCRKPNQTSFREPTVIVSSLEIPNYRTLTGNQFAVTITTSSDNMRDHGTRLVPYNVSPLKLRTQGQWILLLDQWILFLPCPMGKRLSFQEELKLQKKCYQSCLEKKFGGQSKRLLGQYNVHTSYSLPVGKAAKVILVTQVFYDNVQVQIVFYLFILTLPFYTVLLRLLNQGL